MAAETSPSGFTIVFRFASWCKKTLCLTGLSMSQLCKKRRRRRVREKLGEQRKGGTGGPPASLHALAARLPRLPLGFVPVPPPPRRLATQRGARPRRGRPCGGDRSTAETHGPPSPSHLHPVRQLAEAPPAYTRLLSASPPPRPSPAALRESWPK